MLSTQSITEHYRFLEDHLSNIPELEPVFDNFDRAPEHASDVYLGYVALITAMTNLDDSSLAAIAQSQRVLRETGCETGSASTIGANDIVLALGEHRNLLVDLAHNSVKRQSEPYERVVETLVAKIEGGHNLKLSGKSPSDHDPESLQVIWGHTVITNPEALLHFLTAHYLGTYFAKTLSDRGLEFAQQKDFFVNALADVIILDHLGPNTAKPVFDIWASPKDMGGMGWITETRLDSYA